MRRQNAVDQGGTGTWQAHDDDGRSAIIARTRILEIARIKNAGNFRHGIDIGLNLIGKSSTPSIGATLEVSKRSFPFAKVFQFLGQGITKLNFATRRHFDHRL